MATIPNISQLIIEETLEWQKPAIRDVVCECVDIEVSLPFISKLLIEWEEVIDNSFDVLFFAQL